MNRGSGERVALQSGFVGVGPADEWWIVEFYPDHPEISVYVNIGTQPEWDGSRLTHVDLDLDVVHGLDGRVEIIDEDEFVKHWVALGYPGDLVADALDASRRAVELISNSVEPFDTVSKEWIAKVEPESLRRLPER
ncbi:MAG TPA: DUF402 domain-containing protein [Acidimicrobiia bacterium]